MLHWPIVSDQGFQVLCAQEHKRKTAGELKPILLPSSHSRQHGLRLQPHPGGARNPQPQLQTQTLKPPLPQKPGLHDLRELPKKLCILPGLLDLGSQGRQSVHALSQDIIVIAVGI